MNEEMNGRKKVRECEEKGRAEGKKENSSNLSSELRIKYINCLITFFKCQEMVRLDI